MADLIPRAQVFAAAAPGANTPILGTVIVPNLGASTLRVTAAFENATVFFVTMTDGSSSVKLAFNGGASLVADGLYTFTFGARRTLAYNFEIGTNGAIRTLLVEEVTGGVV